LSVEKVRFLRPDVALVFLRNIFSSLTTGSSRARCAAHDHREKVDGGWRIVAMQNTRSVMWEQDL